MFSKLYCKLYSMWTLKTPNVLDVSHGSLVDNLFPTRSSPACYDKPFSCSIMDVSVLVSLKKTIIFGILETTVEQYRLTHQYVDWYSLNICKH